VGGGQACQRATESIRGNGIDAYPHFSGQRIIVRRQYSSIATIPAPAPAAASGRKGRERERRPVFHTWLCYVETERHTERTDGRTDGPGESPPRGHDGGGDVFSGSGRRACSRRTVSRNTRVARPPHVHAIVLVLSGRSCHRARLWKTRCPFSARAFASKASLIELHRRPSGIEITQDPCRGVDLARQLCGDTARDKKYREDPRFPSKLGIIKGRTRRISRRRIMIPGNVPSSED